MKEIERLWSQFQEIRFPGSYTNRWNDDLDIDLAQWDGYCAGCIHTFIENGGTLDSWRLSVLEASLGKLMTMRAGFGHDNPNFQIYIDQLLALCEKVLAFCESSAAD